MDGADHDSGSVYTTPMRSDGQLTTDWSFDAIHPPTSPSPQAAHDIHHCSTSQPRGFSTSTTSSSIFGRNTPESTPSAALSPQDSRSPSNSLPMSALQGAPKTRDTWVEQNAAAAAASLISNTRIPQVEKDADDPNTPLASSSRLGIDRRNSTTSSTLSRLFAVRAPASPEASRTSSYIQPVKSIPYSRSLVGETAALPDHLYNRGLLEGRHSDITVNAFGNQYKLHRLILDRAPFFRSALSEPWLESNAKETTIHPEDIDSTITQASFELALKRLYGCDSRFEEDQDAVGLFATGCWLEMQDLVESSIESMLRHMTPETLSPLMRLVTTNYYGRAGDKILASAKAMLCRDGWRMPVRHWDGIPGDIIREIVGGDGFFIDGEWDRWVLARKILDRRLKLRAIEAGLTEPGSRKRALRVPKTTDVMAFRFDAAYRKTDYGSRGVPEYLHRWITLYTHPDVEPILVLLDEGIHYIHLNFEQLQLIRNARDILGLPVMPGKVINNALWQQMELRQKVVSAREADMELDLSVTCAEDAAVSTTTRDTTMSILIPAPPPASAKGKHKAEDIPSAAEAEENVESGSWDGNGKPRKFWIPSSDCNIVMGGNADPIIATSNNTTLQRHASRLSATIQPEDVQWVSDFAAVTSQPRLPTNAGDNGGRDGGIGEIRYTHFPPYRFAAEFPNPRLLKERKRVYSRTVFYAGSLWNIYIQKVNSNKGKQLGVYLHRAKERETEEFIAGTAGLAQGSVDERIGQLEREMILGSEGRERRHRRRTAVGGGEGVDIDVNDSSGSAGEVEPAFNSDISSSAKPNSMRGLLSRARRVKSGQTDVAGSSFNTSANNATSAADALLNSDSDSDSDSSSPDHLAASSKHPQRSHIPTVPPYVDARPTIKTYFKIYAPSRGGRMLSVYESAPDWFNFSQSWGWKSASLMLDEGLLSGAETCLEEREEGVEGEGEGGKIDGGSMGLKGKGDGKLRFMVVIGNI